MRLPVAAIVGGRDEHLDRSAEDLPGAFRANAVRARAFSGLVIPGADHNFARRERELAGAIVRFARAVSQAARRR